jgi:hypothetical protein
MEKKLSHFLALALSMIVIGGCAHQFVPNIVPLQANQIPIIKTEHPVSIKTLRTNTPEQFIVFVTGVHKYIVRTDDMNNYARTSLKDILKKNNITLTDNAVKKLEVAVVFADSPVIHMVYNFTVKIKAQTGGTITREFTGKDIGVRLEVSVSEAINNALMEMLKDKDFIQYLTE